MGIKTGSLAGPSALFKYLTKKKKEHRSSKQFEDILFNFFSTLYFVPFFQGHVNGQCIEFILHGGLPPSPPLPPRITGFIDSGFSSESSPFALNTGGGPVI